jgi:hypothetical protein
VPWDEKVPKFSYTDARDGAAGGPLFVPTVETARLSYFLDNLMANRWSGGKQGLSCADQCVRFPVAACFTPLQQGATLVTSESTAIDLPFLSPYLAAFPRHYVMFVGNTGTGKTAVIMNKLRGLDPEAVATAVINLNSFSDAPALQLQMEQPLEKKSGVRYGPPGGRKCEMRRDCRPAPAWPGAGCASGWGSFDFQTEEHVMSARPGPISNGKLAPIARRP